MRRLLRASHLALPTPLPLRNLKISLNLACSFDGLEQLLTAIAEEDDNKDLLKNIQDSKRKRSAYQRKLAKRIPLVKDTIAATKLRLKLNLPPQFIATNFKKYHLLTPDQQKQILEFYKLLNQDYLETLTNILNKAATLKIDPTKTKHNYREWNNLNRYLKRSPLQKIPKSINTNIRTQGDLLQGIKSPPKFWSPIQWRNTKDKIRAFRLDLTPKITPSNKPTLEPELKQLSNTSFQLSRHNHQIKIPPPVIRTLELGLKYVNKGIKIPKNKLFLGEIPNFKHRTQWKYFWATKNGQKTEPITDTSGDFLPLTLRKNKPGAKPPIDYYIKYFTDKIESDLTSELRTLRMNHTEENSAQSKDYEETLKTSFILTNLE